MWILPLMVMHVLYKYKYSIWTGKIYGRHEPFLGGVDNEEIGKNNATLASTNVVANEIVHNS